MYLISFLDDKALVIRSRRNRFQEKVMIDVRPLDVRIKSHETKNLAIDDDQIPDQIVIFL